MPAYIRQYWNILMTSGLIYGGNEYMASYKYVGIRIQVMSPVTAPGVSSSQYIFTSNSGIHQQPEVSGASQLFRWEGGNVHDSRGIPKLTLLLDLFIWLLSSSQLHVFAQLLAGHLCYVWLEGSFSFVTLRLGSIRK